MNSINSQYELIEKLDVLIKESISVFDGSKITNEQLINFVYKHFNQNSICSILLKGSCATNRENPRSDVDLLILYEGEDAEVVMHDDNMRYHITLLNKTTKVDFNNPSFRFYYGMKVVYDPTSIGKKIIDDMYQYEIYNNNRLTKQDPKYRNYMYYLKDYVDDDKNIIQAKYAKAKLLNDYPMLLSLYNGYTFIGDRPLVDCLIRDNYELSLLFGKALLKSSTLQDIEDLLDNSFNSLCSINPLDTNFDNSKKSFELYIGNTSIYDLFSNYLDFFKYVNHLKDLNQTGIQFILECKEKTPELFNKLWSLID